MSGPEAAPKSDLTAAQPPADDAGKTPGAMAEENVQWLKERMEARKQGLSAREYTVAAALPDDFFKRQAGQPGGEPKRSYLNHGAHFLLDPASRYLTGENASDEATGYLRGFVKTLPLFMKGRLALPGLAIAYVADEAKWGDSLADQGKDATLGLGKGMALKAGFYAFGKAGATPASTGLGLGILSRGSESLLTRSNYYDRNGQFNLDTGVQKALSVTFNPAALAMDAGTFMLTDTLWAVRFNGTRGAVQYNPVFKNAMASGTMGFTSSFGHELNRQLTEDDKISPFLLARRSLLQGTFDGLAGAAGGWQTKRYLTLKSPKDSPTALAEARNTPFQRGEVVDMRQRQLRDGVFVPDKQLTGLTTETWLGKVHTKTGDVIPAVFRPSNGTEAFAHRMQSEIAGYGLSRLGFKTNIPATVARNVELGGQRYQGFIQEMEGINLAQFFKENASNPRGVATLRSAGDYLRHDSDFRTSYQDAFIGRMIMGEWDNHALNMAVRKRGGASEVRNIDLGDGLRPAQTQLDLVPVPQLRKGFDRFNAVYSHLAGKRISADKAAELGDLHSRFSTRSGRQQLQDLGMTPRQVEGVLGRTEWFAINQFMPRQHESALYLYLGQAKRAVKRYLAKPSS